MKFKILGFFRNCFKVSKNNQKPFLKEKVRLGMPRLCHMASDQKAIRLKSKAIIPTN